MERNVMTSRNNSLKNHIPILVIHFYMMGPFLGVQT